CGSTTPTPARGRTMAAIDTKMPSIFPTASAVEIVIAGSPAEERHALDAGTHERQHRGSPGDGRARRPPDRYRGPARARAAEPAHRPEFPLPHRGHGHRADDLRGSGPIVA